MNVVSYSRSATSEPDHNAHQQREIRGWAASRGHNVVATYAEISGSGAADRPALWEAIAAAKWLRPAGFVVYRLDRLSRDVVLQQTMAAGLDKLGVQLFSVAEELVVQDDPLRVLVGQVIAAFTEFERIAP